MVIDALHLATRANLVASAAIIAVALLRRPVRWTFGASAAYRLWGVPVMAALASFVPAPETGPTAPIVLDAANGLAAVTGLGSGPSWPAALGFVWALGALLCAAMFGTQQARFASALRGASRTFVGGRSVVRPARTDVGPAAVWGEIILPLDFEERFTPAEQAAVIAHETEHLTRGDGVTNAVLAVIQCLCWFNPLVHLAARWIRLDQELACDAAVIAEHPELWRAYAEALLKTQTVAVPPVGCAWRGRGLPDLRDRIRLLKRRGPSRLRRAVGILLLAALTLGGGLAAWAAQPPQDRTVVGPVFSRMPNGADLARLYPQKSIMAEQEGAAVMRCRVSPGGGLSACTIVREAPKGAGFGRAVLQMAPLFKLKPLSKEGRTVSGRLVNIPVSFKLAAAPKDASRQ